MREPFLSDLPLQIDCPEMVASGREAEQGGGEGKREEEGEDNIKGKEGNRRDKGTRRYRAWMEKIAEEMNRNEGVSLKE